jgi:hypothetical protein
MTEVQMGVHAVALRDLMAQKAAFLQQRALIDQEIAAATGTA